MNTERTARHKPLVSVENCERLERREISLLLAERSRVGPQGTIEGIAKPFAAVATDLSNGREVWLRSGPILKAVRASISMPGILNPVEIDGKWLVDGAVTNPVPVSVCRALGADVIIAVNLNGDLVGRRLVDVDEGTKKTLRPSTLRSSWTKC